MIDYETPEECNSRLTSCYLLYQNVLHQYAGAQTKRDGKIQLMLMRCDGLPHDYTNVDMDDPELNVQNIRLGYVNISRLKACAYLSRVPIRQYKQGLSPNVVAVTPKTIQYGWQDLCRLAAPELNDMFANKYPSVEEAKQLLHDRTYTTVAVGRRFALEYERDLALYFVHYRGRRCAFGECDEFRLSSERAYLYDLMKEEGIRAVL